jgi:Coenzyme PQQ synthesis protein D (PqqD)
MRIFKIKPSVVHEKFGDETVILNLDTGSYYSAQGTGSVIWNLVVEDPSEAGILWRVKAEFEGNEEDIAREASRFLDQLVAESLVSFDDGAGEAADLPGQQIGEPKKAFLIPILQKYTDMEELLLLDPIHEVDDHGWPSARRPPD